MNCDINSNTLIKYLDGPMDALAVESLRAELDALVNEGKQHVTLNFSKVDFIDSSGIGAIVFLFKRLSSQQRKLWLEQVNGQPLQLIQYLRIDQAITLLSEEEAKSINLLEESSEGAEL